MKKFLQAFGLFGLVIFAAACLWEAFAQPVPQMRLRDIQDVKHKVPPDNGDALVWSSALQRWTNGVAGGGGGSTNVLENSINTNVLGTNLVWDPGNRYLNIAYPGLFQILSNNITVVNIDATMGGSLLPTLHVEKYLQLSNRTNRLTISSTNTLLLDGVPVASTGNTSNTFNNITVTNAFIVTNQFSVAKGGHLTITNSLTILTNGTMTLSNLPPTSILMVGADQNATNVTLGSGLSFAGTTLSATSSGGGGSTNYRSTVINLTTTGTNVNPNQIDWLLTNQCYRITATNNVFFGDTVCTNVPDTNSFQWLQLNIVQDATGGRLVSFTNSIFAGVNGAFAITTNGNAWDSLTLLNSPQTNGNVAVLPANFLHR